MAKNSSAKGVSLRSKDMTSGGGLGPGPLTVTEAYFAKHDYGGTRKAVMAMFIKGERHGQEMEAEPWTCGQGWDVSDDGQRLIPKAGQSGLPRSAKLSHLITSLEECGMPDDFFTQPSDLVGLEFSLINKPLPKVDGKDLSVLVCNSIESAPWDEKGKGKGKDKGKAKAKDEDEDEDEEEDEEEDDEEDEKPRKGKASRDDDDDDEDDDDDDEDEAPRKKGKASASDSDLDEEAGEALIAALEDGPLKLKDIQAAVALQLKGNKNAKKIAAHAADEDFLNSENGWTFNGKLAKL